MDNKKLGFHLKSHIFLVDFCVNLFADIAEITCNPPLQYFAYDNMLNSFQHI
jgi:hypothetical protein